MPRKETLISGAMLLLITYTLGISFVSQGLPATQSSRTLSSSGTIITVGVGVYSNSQCTTPLTSITWGTLEPGGNQTMTCWIENDGDVSTTLSMFTSNWSPAEAENYLTLSWDYSGQSINPGNSVQVTFTLSVSPSIEGITNFGFDITIVGSN